MITAIFKSVNYILHFGQDPWYPLVTKHGNGKSMTGRFDGKTNIHIYVYIYILIDLLILRLKRTIYSINININKTMCILFLIRNRNRWEIRDLSPCLMRHGMCRILLWDKAARETSKGLLLACQQLSVRHRHVYILNIYICIYIYIIAHICIYIYYCTYIYILVYK